MTLIFTDVDTYEILYNCLGVSETYSGEGVRIVAELFEKFEAIGMPKPGTSNPVLYTLDSGLLPLALTLTDEEFHLLKDAFFTSRWNGFGARQAAKAYYFLLLSDGETKIG